MVPGTGLGHWFSLEPGHPDHAGYFSTLGLHWDGQDRSHCNFLFILAVDDCFSLSGLCYRVLVPFCCRSKLRQGLMPRFMLLLRSFFLFHCLSNSATFLPCDLQVLADKLPELLDFPKDLVSLEVASKVLVSCLTLDAFLVLH